MTEGQNQEQDKKKNLTGDNKKHRSIRVGVLHNGIHAEDAFTFRPDAVTFIRDVRAFPLSLLRYDVVFVLTHTDQVLLLHLKPLLNLYLKLGGVLVLLGVMTQGRKWLPLSQWHQEYTRSIMFDSSGPDGKLIFAGITDPNYLRYHSAYAGHGSLVPSVSEVDKILASDNKGRTIMFIRRMPGAGVLLATTLDPDYHSTAQVPGPADEIEPVTNKKAGHLLYNILNWAEKAAAQTPKWRRRHFIGAVVPTLSRMGLLLSWAFPLLVFVYLLWANSRKNFTFTDTFTGKVVSMLAFIGSLASILSIFMNFVPKKQK